MANTRETMGEQACLDALVAGTLGDFEDDAVLSLDGMYVFELTKTVSLPNCTKIGTNAFYSNYTLVSASFPSATSIGNQAFYECLNLTSINLDSVKILPYRSLYHCSKLESIVLPKAYQMNQESLAQCSLLETVDVGADSDRAPSTYTGCFQGCNNLHSLILRYSGNQSPSIGAFPPNPVNETLIYVPADMLTKYTTSYPNQASMFRTIEEYPVTDYSTISDSWSDIIAASANGTYDSKYNVGDTKSMVIDGNTYYFQLVAKDADVLASDGTTTVPMTWVMFKKLYATKHSINGTSTSDTSWENVSLRSWLSNTVLPLMPAEVQAAIKEVRKYSDAYENGAVVHDKVTADKLWIPSAREVYGGTDYEQAGPIYSDVFSSNLARIKFTQNVLEESWPLRSNHVGVNHLVINKNGTTSNAAITSEYYPAIGFCI